MKFDTLLFGNGLSLSMMDNIDDDMPFDTFNNFLYEFLLMENHKAIKNKFYRIIKSNKRSRVYIEDSEILEIEDFLLSNIDEINKNGYEVWISLKILNDDKVKQYTLYYYALYNYWFCLNNSFFNSSQFKNIAKDYAHRIQNFGIKQVHTLNYDTYLDDYIDVKHIHGKFLAEINNVNELVALYVGDKFYYKICIGTSGFEKHSGLDLLHRDNNPYYDFDFIYNNEIYYGDVLIYGIRFAKASITNLEPVKSRYNDVDTSYLSSVDGHILLRLDGLYNQGKIKSITIAYYREDEIEKYKELLKHRNIYKITNFIEAKKIF